MGDYLITIQAIVFVVLLLIASYVDIKERVIPPIICIGIFLITLINFEIINVCGILVLIPFLYAACICPGSIGGGDIKLIGAASLMLGLMKTNYAIIISFIVLLLYYLIKKILNSKKGQEIGNISLPLAPFLSIGFISVYFLNLGGYINGII